MRDDGKLFFMDISYRSTNLNLAGSCDTRFNPCGTAMGGVHFQLLTTNHIARPIGAARGQSISTSLRRSGIVLTELPDRHIINDNNILS